jgi:hypothetical protein
MRVREEDRNMLLLGSVALVCATLALIATAFEPTSSTAQTASRQAAIADPTPVRIVGVPFVPNTNPREHR